MKNGTESEFGTLYPAVSKGRIASKVFNLQKTTVNPYAVYKDVGNWYDYNTKRTYKIDLKITVTGYKFPRAAIRKQLSNQDLKAPYIDSRRTRLVYLLWVQIMCRLAWISIIVERQHRFQESKD